jgi:hypothetical protein
MGCPAERVAKQASASPQLPDTSRERRGGQFGPILVQSLEARSRTDTPRKIMWGPLKRPFTSSGASPAPGRCLCTPLSHHAGFRADFFHPRIFDFCNNIGHELIRTLLSADFNGTQTAISYRRCDGGSSSLLLRGAAAWRLTARRRRAATPVIGCVDDWRVR